MSHEKTYSFSEMMQRSGFFRNIWGPDGGFGRCAEIPIDFGFRIESRKGRNDFSPRHVIEEYQQIKQYSDILSWFARATNRVHVDRILVVDSCGSYWYEPAKAIEIEDGVPVASD